MSEPPVKLSATLTGAAGAPVLVLGNSLGTTGNSGSRSSARWAGASAC